MRFHGIEWGRNSLKNVSGEGTIGLAAEPPEARVPGEGRVGIGVHAEVVVVPPVVLTILEEVHLAITVLHSRIYIVGDPVPVGNLPRIRIVNGRRSFRVEFPIPGTFEEVYFVVEGPHEGCVNISGNTAKPSRQTLRISIV